LIDLALQLLALVAINPTVGLFVRKYVKC
jgi:hypothetical protein